MPSVCAPSTSSGYASTSSYADTCSASSPTCGPFPCDRTSRWLRATAASAGAALRTFARCASAVMGSPRFRSAFPPSATTTLIVSSSLAERGDHDGLDGVHPILGLVEDDRPLRLEYLLGHLQPVQAEPLVDVCADLRLPVVERGQAVHELDVRVASPPHDVEVHLVRLQEIDALLPHARVLAHRDPDVGVEEVCSMNAFVDVSGEREACAGFVSDPARRLDELLARPQLLGSAEPHVHAEL